MQQIDFTDLAGMRGEVTADDIRKGERGDCTFCPVVFAVERMFAGYDAYVGLDVELYQDGEMRFEFFLGSELMDWIAEYDNWGNMKPIQIEVSTWNRRGYKYMIDIATETD